jgi:hypothetical protein
MGGSHPIRMNSSLGLALADGSYNLAAIMAQAVRHARRYPSLRCWQRQMAVALRHVWSRAKAERLASAH